MLDEKNRGLSGICLCCGSATTKQTTLTSKFLSNRAWGGPVEWSDTSKCSNCGFAFHGRGLTQAEINSFYKSYRDEKYFIDRNSCEPFYTRKIHDAIDSRVGGEARRTTLNNYLLSHGCLTFQPNSEPKILDFAGGGGRYISEMPGEKFVYDVSGELPVEGVASISENEVFATDFDLIVCAQMIEHASDPMAVAKKLFERVKPGGYLYIEVPFDETWIDYSCSGWLRDKVLTLAIKYYWFNMALDFYGTAFRVKFHVLPPLAFVPVREHLNYFTPESLTALGRSIGGYVIDASRDRQLGTRLLLQKVDLQN